MKRLFLDSGAVDRLARGNLQSDANVKRPKDDGNWPPHLHTVVLAECVSGRQRDDAPVNRFIKTCNVVEELPKPGSTDAVGAGGVGASIRKAS